MPSEIGPEEVENAIQAGRDLVQGARTLTEAKSRADRLVADAEQTNDPKTIQLAEMANTGALDATLDGLKNGTIKNE